MIPTTNTLLNTELEVQQSRAVQHRMTGGRIIGRCDGMEALRQTIYKILNTERYAYDIYSWDYGVELADLFGEPVTYVCPEIERRIQEALLMDDRITGVDSFEFDTETRGTVKVAFTVHSIYGNIDEERTVNI